MGTQTSEDESPTHLSAESQTFRMLHMSHINLYVRQLESRLVPVSGFWPKMFLPGSISPLFNGNQTVGGCGHRDLLLPGRPVPGGKDGDKQRRGGAEGPRRLNWDDKSN